MENIVLIIGEHAYCFGKEGQLCWAPIDGPTWEVIEPEAGGPKRRATMALVQAALKTAQASRM
jgi:hypothetical protein